MLNDSHDVLYHDLVPFNNVQVDAGEDKVEAHGTTSDQEYMSKLRDETVFSLQTANVDAGEDEVEAHAVELQIDR
ncbi:hypothetical protein QVD17_00919 [Tagetes erecta]|uniref:Uncharacterized protein n=1 Tax=Tagetes erecta TaxID=13708 RepID=A0AAD8L6N7_TARER|nr:hypothetical protein QVD17_00919 [Tagetes erecta]